MQSVLTSRVGGEATHCSPGYRHWGCVHHAGVSRYESRLSDPVLSSSSLHIPSKRHHPVQLCTVETVPTTRQVHSAARMGTMPTAGLQSQLLTKPASVKTSASPVSASSNFSIGKCEKSHGGQCGESENLVICLTQALTLAL